MCVWQDFLEVVVGIGTLANIRDFQLAQLCLVGKVQEVGVGEVDGEVQLYQVGQLLELLTEVAREVGAILLVQFMQLALSLLSQTVSLDLTQTYFHFDFQMGNVLEHVGCEVAVEVEGITSLQV